MYGATWVAKKQGFLLQNIRHLWVVLGKWCTRVQSEYRVFFLNWSLLVQYQNEKRRTSQAEALLDRGFHRRAALAGSLAFSILLLNWGGGRGGKITLYVSTNLLPQTTIFCQTAIFPGKDFLVFASCLALGEQWSRQGQVPAWLDKFHQQVETNNDHAFSSDQHNLYLSQTSQPLVV